MKKGFTLIELLAVIVILAIIALIAVPIVLNIIAESKENATLRSGEFYLDAVELSIAQAKLNNKNISNGTYNIKSGNICLNNDCTDILEVEVNGEVPKSGSIIISNGKITEGTTINFENTSLVLNSENKLLVPEPGILLSSEIIGENNKNVVSSGDGLYVSTATNDGSPTYYFKGNLVNNYVDFANLTWRIVRINEDGTIKLILDNGINNNMSYLFNPDDTDYKYMYYSESAVENGIKTTVDAWYATTLETNYDSYISTTNFCESAKVKDSDSWTSGDATMELSSSYTPNFKCSLDGNNKQYVSAKAGLITADEAAMAGIPLYTGSQINNTNTYLQKSYYWWTMSPGGFFIIDNANAWFVTIGGFVSNSYVSSSFDYPDGHGVRPVISLNANVTIEESNGNGVHGSSTNPYVIDVK